MKKTLRRLSAFFMSAVFLLTTAIPALAAGENAPPSEIESCEVTWDGNIKILFSDTEADHTWIRNISSLSIDGTDYNKATFSFGMSSNEYYPFTNGTGYNEAPYLLIKGEISGTAECVIGAEGYSDLTLELEKNGSNCTATIKDNSNDGDEDDPDPTPQVKELPSISDCANYWDDFKITFSGTNTSDWLSNISKITVADTTYESGYVYNNTKYSINSTDFYIIIGSGFSGNTADCVITADGYSDLTLTLDKTSYSATIKEGSGGKDEPCEHTGGTATCTEKAVCDTCGEEYGDIDPDNHNFVNGKCTRCGADDPDYTEPAPTDVTVTVDTTSWDSSTYFILQVTSPDEYVGGLTSISYKDEALEKAEYKISLNGTKYYLDTVNNAIYFSKLSGIPFASGDIITLNHSAYGALSLKITIAGNDVTITPVSGEEEAGDTYTLYVRLVGYFESAIVNQKGYDAISGASTNITQNKNSNVVVEAALMEKDTEPSEDDWVLLHDNSDITVDTKNTKINMDDDFGMAGVYSVYDSSITLAGTPTKAGSYEISITLTDDQGRTATSNALIFTVYTGQEYLEDQLTLESCTQTQDGKYMYDMEPWAMVNFCQNAPQEVTVPKDIKAWYGSHTSGTYGELGYAVSEGEETTQTLIVPSGCDLTLVNMNILSSVRIVVEDGGKLVLQDSVVQGVIEVKDGGTFSMNYDSFNQEFLTGASINGQLILKDGATLENAKIYSNTNNVPNGTEARQNTDPVVVVKGNVTVNGQVYIHGDEAPTGTDPDTGETYAGQSGLKVENGSLTITEDSVLAVYGGGYLATTTNGGAAIILDDGTISGEGTLIAVGGNSMGLSASGKGGNALEGNGSISTAYTYLEGGNAYAGTPGAAKTENITVSSEHQNLINGTKSDEISDTYWSAPSLSNSLPVLSKYTFDGGDTPTPPAPPVEEEKQYTITFNANNGSGETTEQTVSTTSDSATATLNANSFVRSKYRFTSWNTEADGTGTSYANGASIEINGDITLYAQWKRKSSSSSSSSNSSSSNSSATQYAVKIADSENGSVSSSPAKAEKGGTVTLTVTPDEGYELSKLTVTDKNGDTVKLTEKNNGKYTFIMPASKVTVDAVFVKAEETSAAPEEVKTIILTIGQKVANVFGELVINDVAPLIRNDRTMLPARFVAEALGGTVEWNDDLNKVTITKEDLTIEIFIGSASALVNGESVALDSPAFIENSRTYLPLRFIAENLGAAVTWDQTTQQVTITPTRVPDLNFS